jgi:hypothetical protein
VCGYLFSWPDLSDVFLGVVYSFWRFVVAKQPPLRLPSHWYLVVLANITFFYSFRKDKMENVQASQCSRAGKDGHTAISGHAEPTV